MKMFFIAVAVLAAIYTVVPKPKLLESYNFSSAFFDNQGRLLKLSLSLDEKYRIFVPIKDVPEYSKQALILYEDKYFYLHLGFNPVSFVRAVFDMATGSRKQGASTITMQLARVVYNIDTTTVLGKIEQILRALQIEMFYTKQQILEAYFNLSPYGSNIEGIGAASIIYFNTNAKDLNLQQSIALTVIPQNPNKRNLSTSRGRKEVELASTRLKEIWKENYSTPQNSYLDLPLYSGRHLPFYAPHFTRFVAKKNVGEVYTTIDLNFQNMLEDIVEKYLKEHKSEGINNASAIILDYKTMEVKALLGSADFFRKDIYGQVDGTTALRSPGSTLKPFIYALALDEGLIHPLTMLKDVPRNYGVYTPENFDHSFYGLISATSALVYSRNIPAVDLLLSLKKNSFYNLLKKSGVRKLRSPDFYGLALALGGGEVSVQDVAKLYAMLGNLGEMKELQFIKDQKNKNDSSVVMSKEAAFLTLDMLSYNDPIDQSNIKFSVPKKNYPIYWKTGTSFGFKDAWTAGIVGDYVVVVWVGNFDSTSNSAFIGRSMAAPLFFKITRSLAKNHPIKKEDRSIGLNLQKVNICKATGDIANQYCKKTIKSYFIPGVSSIKVSNVSRLIPIDIKTGLRACRHTPPTTRLEEHNFWPSDILKVFEQAGVHIKRPPEFLTDCDNLDTFSKGEAPKIVLPIAGSIYALRSSKLDREKFAFQANADSDASIVYWFMDDVLVGQSKPEEAIEVKAKIGDIRIKAVDDMGRSSVTKITAKLVD